jgi:hypothetical protein
MNMNSLRSILVAYGLLLFLSGRISASELFIERLEPPCFTHGAKTLVTVHGLGVNAARRLWTTLPGDAIQATHIRTSNAKTTTFEVTVSKETSPGLYGLRIGTDSGLSNLHLFAIEDLPVVFEKESRNESDDPSEQRTDQNNLFKNAEEIRLPASIVGTAPESDVDSFAIDVKANQRVSFETVGSRLGKAFDPLVTIFDTKGRRVRSSDNSMGLIFDSRFQHTFQTAGRYIVQLRDTRFHGSAGWSYMLRMGRFPAARVAIPSTVQPGSEVSLNFPELGKVSSMFDGLLDPQPSIFERNGSSQRFYFGFRDKRDEGSAWFSLAKSKLANHLESEPNDSADKATQVTVPANLHGIINESEDEDWFQFELKKGASLTFRAETRDMASPADLELALIGPTGKELRRKDDEGFDDAHFTFRAAEDGVHRLQVVDVIGKGGPEFVYRIEVSLNQPRLDLTSDAGRLAIPQGSWQPLLLSVKRTNFKGPVELSLQGAPAGISLQQHEILANQDSLAGALNVAADVPQGIYTIQVIARGADTETSPGPTAVARTFPLIDRVPTGRGPHGEPFELREDQRRLPPTVIDRLAVAVLPKAPFDFVIEPDVVVLPRYVETSFDIKTTFSDAIDGDVTFEARGGTLETNRLRKPTTESFIPPTNAKTKTVTARLTSGVNSPLQKHEVTVTGAAKYQGRTVYLTRVFELAIEVAFDPQSKDPVEVKPGETISVTLNANRLAPFDGPVVVDFDPVDDLQMPAQIKFAQGQSETKFELKVAEQHKPGKARIRFTSSAKIDKFSEKKNGYIDINVNVAK